MIARARSGNGWGGEAATVMAAVITVMGSLESGIEVWGGYFGTRGIELAYADSQ